MIAAKEALNKLKEGNKRFVSGSPLLESLANSDRRIQLQSGQEPFAIILGCSDSRVPSEIVFDFSLGHLFVVRVAGNIVAPSQLGSIEYATSQFGTRLVVVMGHSDCGAVSATIDQLSQSKETRSPNLSSIVNRLQPAVEPLMNSGLDEEELLNSAVRANILQSVDQLRFGSEILSGQIDSEGLEIVGAQYSLSTGKVNFL
jgi:carbonic anhydrase